MLRPFCSQYIAAVAEACEDEDQKESLTVLALNPAAFLSMAIIFAESVLFAPGCDPVSERGFWSRRRR